MRGEFLLIQTAFDMMPRITTTGLFDTIFTQTGNFTFTLPGAPGTFATTANVATETTRATAAEATNATAIATNTTAIALLAPKASPALTGVPTAPTVAATALAGTTQLATTAFARNGTTTNDSAIAGQVGEYIASSVNSPGSGLLISTTQYTITSISLTAGDWDVSGTAWFGQGGGPVSFVAAGISLVAATLPGGPSVVGALASAVGPLVIGVASAISLATTRISLAGTTTVYLAATATFTSTPPFAYGTISARRVR